MKSYAVASQVSKFFSDKIGLGRSNSPKHKSPGNASAMATAIFGVETKGPVIDNEGVQCFDIVILGGGMAAWCAVTEMVKAQEQFKYSIAIVSRDNHPPFYAGEMVQLMANNRSVDESIIAPEEWFQENRVTLMLNTNVTFVDVKRRLLVADSADPSQSNHFRLRATRALILATGGRPNYGPPLKFLEGALANAPVHPRDQGYGQVGGVFTLRTLAEGRAINAWMATAKHVVVIGGGFLGLDMAYIARRRGLDVTLIGGQQLLSKIFTQCMSDMYRDFLEKNGVRVVLKNECLNILVSGDRVVGVLLEDGTRLECDMVTATCGVVPNVDLFRGQLQLEKGTKSPGVLVDSFLLTSVPGVYAIGDLCAMRYSQHNPGAIRHLSNARASGKHIALGIIAALNAAEAKKRRGSKVELKVESAPASTKEFQETVLRALMPGGGAAPYVPHPAYDVNHFDFRGYVSGDRLGPDFIKIGEDMGPGNKLVTFWLWENRLVGAFVSNPTDEEKALLDKATSEQWYILNMPELRAITDAMEALSHISQYHRS